MQEKQPSDQHEVEERKSGGNHARDSSNVANQVQLKMYNSANVTKGLQKKDLGGGSNCASSTGARGTQSKNKTAETLNEDVKEQTPQRKRHGRGRERCADLSALSSTSTVGLDEEREAQR